MSDFLMLLASWSIVQIFSLGPYALAQTTDAPSPPTLDAGYHQMYNLQFEDAHKTFRAYQDRNPGDPLGPTSDAAVYLFSEFDRLGILESELFTNDEKFQKRQKLTPEPAAKQGFDTAINRSELLSDRILMSSQQNSDALFAKVLNRGLRSDYLALIEKRQLASLSYMKGAGVLAEKLLAVDPSRYDAYLAVGVENYILGLKAAPMRVMLRAYGAKTDKDQGISNLQLTAEKGRYLLPFARLLLAVAALRNKDTERAKELLQGLTKEFPNNKLYAKELSRLQ